jgi:hypothetical protein
MRRKLKIKHPNVDVWLSRIANVSIISGVLLYSLCLLWNHILDSKDTNIIGFAGSILGGVIGGLLTLWGVAKTINIGQKDKYISEFPIKLKFFKQLLIQIEHFNIYEFDNIVKNDHVKRMTIDEYDIRNEINQKFEKIKDIAANIDAQTYYLIEDYEEFIVDEVIYYYEEARQYDLKMINERTEPDEGATELRNAMLDLFDELNEKKNDIFLDLYSHREALENKYFKFNPLAKRPKILWSRKLIEDFNNRKSDEGWEHYIND